MSDAEHTSQPIVIKNGNGWWKYVVSMVATAAVIFGGMWKFGDVVYARSERVAVVEGDVKACDASWVQQTNLNGRFDTNDKEAIQQLHRIELRLIGIEARIVPERDRVPPP